MHELDETELDQALLWKQHWVELVRYATLLVGPHDAADVVSIAFDRVRRSNTPVQHVRPYLFRAVTTIAMDQHRGRRRRQVRDLHALLPPATLPPESNVDVRRAIAALSVQQRSVVYFTYWEDLDAAAVGEVLGITPDTVRRHLARARAHLRKALR